jgi:hypothetical protein
MMGYAPSEIVANTKLPKPPAPEDQSHPSWLGIRLRRLGVFKDCQINNPIFLNYGPLESLVYWDFFIFNTENGGPCKFLGSWLGGIPHGKGEVTFEKHSYW